MSTATKKEEGFTLEILAAIDADSGISQRSLAKELGVALGLANSYLRRCVHKGLVKVQEAPANRYLYYLTPKGFTEKSRLTAQYLSYSFDFYRRAGESLKRVFADSRREGRQRIVLAGASDLAEIALLRVAEFDLQIVAVYDPNLAQATFHGLPLYGQIDHLPEHDVCVITDVQDPAGLLERMRQEAYQGLVVAPDILGLMHSLAGGVQ